MDVISYHFYCFSHCPLRAGTKWQTWLCNFELVCGITLSSVIGVSSKMLWCLLSYCFLNPNLLSSFHGNGKMSQVLIYTPVFWLGLDLGPQYQQSQQEYNNSNTLRNWTLCPSTNNWLESCFNSDGCPHSWNRTIPVHLSQSSTMVGKLRLLGPNHLIWISGCQLSQDGEQRAISTWILNQFLPHPYRQTLQLSRFP